MNIYSMTLKDLETYFINIGEKKRAIIKNAAPNTAVRPVLPPWATPALLST